MMAFPLCLNIDYVLHLWLVDVPDYAALFIILIMIDALCGTLLGLLYDIFVSNGVDTELPNCCKLHHIVHFSDRVYCIEVRL